VNRVQTPEIMDTMEISDGEMDGALDFLRITNRYFGGTRSILKHLEKFSRNWKPGETIRILDVGCGLADIDLEILKWASLKNYAVNITGLEMIPQIAGLARKSTGSEKRLEILERDIFSFDAPHGAYDYVIASLFLHHVPDDKMDILLKKLDTLSARGMILSDLERSWSGWAAVTLLSRLIGNRITRNDGPLSVRRAYCLSELQALAERNGLPYLRAIGEGLFRIALVGEK